MRRLLSFLIALLLSLMGAVALLMYAVQSLIVLLLCGLGWCSAQLAIKQVKLRPQVTMKA